MQSFLWWAMPTLRLLKITGKDHPTALIIQPVIISTFGMALGLPIGRLGLESNLGYPFQMFGLI